MNEPRQRPGDDRLSAWLDSQLDADEGAVVQDWLREHPEDAAQVRLWAADGEALRARFGPVIDEPVPERLLQTVQGARDRSGWPRHWGLAAAAAGLFALGTLLGSLWQPLRTGKSDVPLASAGESLLMQASTPRWPQRAALAHAVYAPEVRHPVEVSVREGDAAFQREQEQHLARWLTRRVNMPVKLFDLRDQGFDLVGGRLLPDASGPSAQLMYQDAAGQRVTIYLRKPEDDTPAAFRYEQHNGLGMFYWIDGSCGYALVGPQSRERLLALAESIYRQDQLAHAASAPGK